RSPVFLGVTLAVVSTGTAAVSWVAAIPPSVTALMLLLALVSTVLAIVLVARTFARRQHVARSPAPPGVSDELCRLIEAAHAVAWDWDVKTGYDVFFGDLKSTFGLAERWHGGTVQEFHQRVHRDDRGLVGQAVAEARDGRTPYRATFRVVWPDGTVRWL